MQPIIDGIAYKLADGNGTTLVFVHYDERLHVIVEGAKTTDVLNALLHRHRCLNEGQGYHPDATEGIHGLVTALNAFTRLEANGYTLPARRRPDLG